MVTTLSETTRPARKPHSCDECGRTISKGQVYLRQANTDSSQIWTYKAHTDCAEMSQQFRSENKLWSDEWYPLHEYFVNSGQINAWRGLFPHAACRIAFTQNLNP